MKYSCKTTKQLCMDCCAYIWCFPWTYCGNVTEPSFFCRNCSGRCSSELAEFGLISYFHRDFTHSNRLHDFPVIIPRCYKHIYLRKFFYLLAPCNQLTHIRYYTGKWFWVIIADIFCILCMIPLSWFATAVCIYRMLKTKAMLQFI